jgi:pimeloyl-ACP methyl ester carboxylesterase
VSVRVEWGRVRLGGGRAVHATAGDGGSPALFLHGWGIGPLAYSRAMGHLAAIGCRVLAPAQPGFGGTPALGKGECSFPGYARFAARYLDVLGIREPVTVVGHSFGGGVALQLAHDFPERVRGVVLCNAVGGPLHGPVPLRPMADRPLWSWGRDIGADLFALSALSRVVPAVLGGALPNLLQNPAAMWRVAGIARRADLVDQAATVARRGVPLTIVWSDRDRLVPYASHAALCRATGVRGEVVAGTHSWLIAEPHRLADVVLRAMVEAGVVEHALSRRARPVAAIA